jgi:nucleotide-binding universal stress UspA family protein
MPTILLPVDGSDRSLDAVAYVVQLMESAAPHTAFEVVLAHVQAPASLYELVTTRDPALIAAASREAGEHLIAPAMTALQAKGISVTAEYDVGDVAHTLLDILERTACDLVVIGTQERGEDIGPVLLEVLRNSPVPVTVIKHTSTQPLDD